MAFALLALTVVGATLTTAPAKADHLNFSHWGNGYGPWVSVPNSTLWHFTAEAEWGWSVNGYRNGFCTSTCAPAMPCNGVTHSGGITVCKVSRNILPSGALGTTTIDLVYNPQAHIDAVYIRVCGDCYLNDDQMHRAVNHEYGHALGQNHTRTYPCVMQSPNYFKYQCGHERDVMAWAYTPHNEG
jgi:hypothetical protein